MDIHSVHECGGKGIIVAAETSLSNGLPTIILIEFAGKSLIKSRERVSSAFSDSSVPLLKKNNS